MFVFTDVFVFSGLVVGLTTKTKKHISKSKII